MTTDEAKTWGGLIANAFIGFMLVWAAYQRKVQNKKQNEHNDEQSILARDTHTLVNSQNTAQKKVIADLAATKAKLEPTDANRQEADARMLDYLDHVRKQKIVDAAQAADAVKEQTSGTKAP